MKKIIALSVLAISVAATSAFAQGYLQLASTANSQIWDGFTTAGVSARSSFVDVGLFWAPASTANPFALASTPTTGNSTTTESYTAAQAWAALLGSGFQLAFDNTALNQSVISLSSTKGGISYNGGSSFGIQSTTPGVTYTLMEVSWSSAYANPALAAAANGGLGSAIGWSAPLQYTMFASTDQTVTKPGFVNFGTFVPAVVPEPGTLALAALGGAAMLMIRRKK
jgi:hypothetical protein